jgi:capsular exopolysaccharide synthesis family protein
MSSTDRFLAVIWRRRVSFLATFLVIMAGVAAVTYSLPKVYTTSSYLLVSSLKAKGGAFEAQQITQVDTQTVAELLQTRNAANTVAAAMPYRISATAVQSKVSISPVAQTELVLITAHESSPLRAQQLANIYANSFAQQAASTIASATVTVAAPAALTTSPTSPRPKLYLLIGAILALLAATGVALLRQRLDQRLVIEDFATELLGLPILARVPERRDARTGILPATRERATPQDLAAVESFRMLLVNLSFVGLGHRPSTIAVISADEREGKSTVSAAIAQTATEMAGSVLLVDGDLRRPSLSEQFAVAGAPGLSSFLAHSEAGRDHLSRLLHDVPGSELHVVGSGPPPPNPSSLLGLPSLEDFLDAARSAYDFVVFDTPPVGVGADASLIAARTEGAILVVDTQVSRRASLEWTLQQLRRAQVNVLGVIVNRVSDTGIATRYYHHSGLPPSVETDSPAGRRRAASRAV